MITRQRRERLTPLDPSAGRHAAEATQRDRSGLTQGAVQTTSVRRSVQPSGAEARAWMPIVTVNSSATAKTSNPNGSALPEERDTDLRIAPTPVMKSFLILRANRVWPPCGRSQPRDNCRRC